MIAKSACFLGHSTGKIPYKKKSPAYEELEKVLSAQIKRLMWEGVSEFYVGGQTEVDMLAAKLVLHIRDGLFSTAYLHVVLPFRDIAIHTDSCGAIYNQTSTVTCLNETYHPGCYRKRNEYMIHQCTHLVAIDAEHEQSEMQLAIGMAKKHRLNVIIINPFTFKVAYE